MFNHLYKAALDSLEDGILISDHCGKVIIWNDRFCSMWNLTASFLSDTGLTDVFDRIAASVDANESNGLPGSDGAGESAGGRAIDLVLTDGRIIERYGSPLRDETESGCTIWRFRDVTPIRKKQWSMESSISQLAEIIEFLPEPTMVVNENGVIVVWNKAIEDVSGVKKEDIIGRGDYEYALPFYNIRRPILIDWALGGNNVPIEKYDLVQRKDGLLYGEIYTPNAFGGQGAYLWGVAAPLKDKSGKTVGAVECMRNVTERKMVEQELNRAKLAAEAATKAKSEFLARMSHEIRTPMNAILGMTELLSETNLTYDQMDYVQTLHFSGEMLLAIINDILDFSKIEAGQVELESVAFDLIDHVEGIGRILGGKAQEKGLELAYRVAPEVHRYVLGDPTRLKQVLINLLSNAIKFTEEGEVTLHIQPGPDPDDREMIQVSVSDTGIGIPEDKWQSVFDSFSQADTSTTRSYGGTGLGLAISKKLVELMGGRIWVDSRLGEGTTFFITIKLKHTDQAPSYTADYVNVLEKLANKKILVVDDNATNRLLLHDHLTRWGAVVALAENGPAALAAIRETDLSGAAFDIVFLDVLMPGMSGMEVARTLKELYPEAPPHIIINTSSDTLEDRAEARKLGLDGFLPKPVKRADLIALLSTIVGYTPQDAVLHVKPDLQVNLNGLKLLLVEDIAANRKVIRRFLEDTGIEIIEAVNGQVAVDAYTQAGGRFDIVIMDREMPIMDGLEATRKIRRFEQDQGMLRTPIVALTAHAFNLQKEQSMDAGCDEFLSKPVRKKELLRVIMENIAFSSQSLDSGTGAPENTSPSDSKEEKIPAPRPGVVIVEVEADLADLIPEFLEEIRQEMEHMDQALKREAFDDLHRLAHGFKGAAANYDMQILSDIYQELEYAAKTGDGGKSKDILDRANDVLSRLEIKYIEA